MPNLNESEYELSVRNFIQIRSDLTFLLYDVYKGLLFSGHSFTRLESVPAY